MGIYMLTLGGDRTTSSSLNLNATPRLIMLLLAVLKSKKIWNKEINVCLFGELGLPNTSPLNVPSTLTKSDFD
jgi:hypothetical protein